MRIDSDGPAAPLDYPGIANARPGAQRTTAIGRAMARRLRRWFALIVTVGILVVTTGAFFRSMAMQAPPAPLPLSYPFVQSPNYDDRPQCAVVNCIVLHSTVEPTTEGTLKIFLTPEKRVSAHFVVGRDGRVVQMVRVEQRAWHAGASVLDNVEKVNDYSVGIEMVNLNDREDPYTPEQMDAVAGIIRHVRSGYNVPDARIVSHAQIAVPVGRKSDPAGFDFEKIRAMARSVPSIPSHLDGPPPPPVLPLPSD